MIVKKEEIVSFMNKANLLINEKDLDIKKIYEYTFIQNKNRKVFEYFDSNNKYKHISYKKADKLIRKYAAYIQKEIGEDKKHNVVVLRLANSPEWCELFYAILMAGYKVILVNIKTSKDGVNNLINQSKAVAVITDDPFTYNVKKILVDEIVTSKNKDKFVSDWENEVIFCSSGTTGDVKLMVFNGENLCHQIASSLEMANTTRDIMYPDKYGKIKILAMIPFHHIFGFVAVFLWYTFYGKTVVFPSSANSKEIQTICNDKKITHLYSVPLFWDSLALQYERQIEMSEEPTKTYLNDLLKMNLDGTKKLKKIVVKKIQEKVLGPNIRMCISGGGYLSENTSKIINGIGYPLYNGFGMTEIGVTSVELSPIVSTRTQCAVGKPFHGVSYKIANGGNNVELLVKSKAIHSREIIGGKEIESQLDDEGYFHTGDIAEVDENGNYFMKGRIKDVIINANGENVFPDEIELYFKHIENIINFTIVGIRDHKKDHKEEVSLVAEISSTLEPQSIQKIKDDIKLASKNLPKGVNIDRIYLSTCKLPMANSIKVKRHVIKEDIEAGSTIYSACDKSDSKKKEVNFDEKVVKEILVPVKKLFCEILVLPENKVENDSHWINDLGGDSMNYFELISKINERFAIVIPDKEFSSLCCVNDFVEFIESTKN